MSRIVLAEHGELLRLTRAADGRVIEYVTSLLNPAHFALHLEF